MNGKQQGMERRPQRRTVPSAEVKFSPRLPAALFRRAKAEAALAGVTLQEFVRDAVQTALRRRHGQESR